MNEAGKACGMGILGRHEPGSVGNAGGMNGGVMIGCSLELCRRLSDTAKFPLIEKLSKVSQVDLHVFFGLFSSHSQLNFVVV